MRWIILILCTGLLTACGSTSSYQESAQWSEMNYANVGDVASASYLSISPGMGIK